MLSSCGTGGRASECRSLDALVLCGDPAAVSAWRRCSALRVAETDTTPSLPQIHSLAARSRCGSVPRLLVRRLSHARLSQQRLDSQGALFPSCPIPPSLNAARSSRQLWDLKTYKIRVDLPGHSDEVYCVDFVADKIASGGRDKKVKM